ncbi:MAG: hypothetical protein H6925_01165 [Holosporaceae bacterium]|nr:MAG: hypothetical protein H6925_01165 [Holosporaceae bacterium]
MKKVIVVMIAAKNTSACVSFKDIGDRTVKGISCTGISLFYAQFWEKMYRQRLLVLDHRAVKFL